MEPVEDYSDPCHIYNVRARRAADEAERDLFREIEPPQQSPFGMLMRALKAEFEPNEGGDA